MSTRRNLYRFLSLWGAASAANRGPSSLLRFQAHRVAHRQLARLLRSFR